MTARPPALSKPLPRSERLRKPPPSRELPRREDLIRLFTRYDVPAPRYTSYPPATQFVEGYDSELYADHISRSAHDDPSGISLYLHLPFCDTLCYFCGCTMIVSNNREKIAEYVQYLKREITLMASALESRPVVVQMHWGGGSPTHLLPGEIEDLGRHLRDTFQFAGDAELSIEIDPRGVTEEHIAAMKSVGFNRASIGVQDFNRDVQVAVNRIQPRSITEQVIAWCRAAGMTSINLDLIYGLPYQTSESFSDTLEAVKEISPDRIAVYNFAYVPWIKPHQKLIEIETLPAATTRLALLELAISELTEAGYLYLGMDHFAKPSDPLAAARHSRTLHRNFQGYSTLAGKDLYAFGLSAIGRIENTFVQNTKNLEEYYRLIDEERLPIERGYELTPDDEIREFLIMEIMCNGSVEKNMVERLFGINFDRYFRTALAQLESLAKDNLCQVETGKIQVTETGRYFLRNVALAFDAYHTSSLGKPKFSQAV
ncbi:MAG TPA: oxygen-independent coproporphyrinogen III oxidase [Candidatus Kapabacteria bacterium]|nr:oxygen-independent coproporphyrinogen III oxidase [Candidatus Kapabacteria bacterium]